MAIRFGDDESSYTFDFEANQNELAGNTTLYRVNTGGSGVSGNINVTPDFSKLIVNPQAFFSAIPSWFWYVAASVTVLWLVLRKRQ